MNHPRFPCALFPIALLLGSAAVSTAAEFESVTPRREGGWVVVDLRARDVLDARTRSTIESGLPGSLGLLVVLEEEGGRLVSQVQSNRRLLLDLWEGTARVEEADHSWSFDGLAAADSAWSRFEGLRIAALSALAEGRRYRLHAELRVRPLGADDRDRVARWVSRSDDGRRTDVRLDVGKLLSHFVAGGPRDDGVGVRRTSGWFRLSSLRGEAPTP